MSSAEFKPAKVSKKDGGFWSADRNFQYWWDGTKIMTPIGILAGVSGAIGLTPIAGLCVLALFVILVWRVLLKHVFRFFFSLAHIEYNVDTDVATMTKPFPWLLQIDPSDPYK